MMMKLKLFQCRFFHFRIWKDIYFDIISKVRWLLVGLLHTEWWPFPYWRKPQVFWSKKCLLSDSSIILGMVYVSVAYFVSIIIWKNARLCPTVVIWPPVCINVPTIRTALMPFQLIFYFFAEYFESFYYCVWGSCFGLILDGIAKL